MLKQLRIQNYAIIDDLVLDLGPGLTVFTGETGAGKSIIVGALGLVLGDRTTDEVIRKGEERCLVEAVFEVTSSTVRRLRQIDPQLGSNLRLRREIPRQGRSRCWVDDRQVPIGMLRAIGNLLVDFHGQHEHQRLLQVGTHVDFLDGFAKHGTLRTRVRESRRQMIDLRHRIREIEERISKIADQEHIITHDIEEIERMNLTPEEDVAIERELRLLSHGESIIEKGTRIVEDLYEGDESAISKIAEAIALMDEIASYSCEISSLRASLDEANVIIKEVAETLRDRIAEIDLDPSRLESLRDRLGAIERLKRKYGKNLSELLSYLDSLKAELGGKADLEVELEHLRTQLDQLEHNLVDLCLELRAKRKKAAKQFETAVQAELKALGISGAKFRVVFDDLEEGDEISLDDGSTFTVSESGADYVEFFVRTNVGEELLPLRRIASGGEVSRVMLALKKLLATSDEIETLIFDEIDVGIGGSLADTVASRLTDLGRSHQVICITHLPQIAAAATIHFAVGKRIEKGRTITDVRLLDQEARVAELARMIGGRKPADSARAHAATLLRRTPAG